MKSHVMWLVCGFVFYALAEPVQAGAVVELRLADLTGAPIDCTPTLFLPGNQFLVELWLKPDQNIVIREMSIDYRGSDFQIIPSFGIDIDAVNQPLDGIPNFWFDYSSTSPFGTYPASGITDIVQVPISTTGSYIDFSNLISGNPYARVPASTVTVLTSPSNSLIMFTGGIFSRVGGMPITIPGNIHPSQYFIDLLGSPTGEINDRNNGSSIVFGFGSEEDPVTI